MDDNQESVELLKQISRGSRDAFDPFYEKYSAFIFNIAYQVTGNRIEAEDVCHDVFLEVFQKSSQYQPDKGSVRAWLAVKTKSRSIDRLRKKKPLLIEKLEKLSLQEVQGVDLQFLKEIENHLIHDALVHLPKPQREAIYRSYFAGETHKEIAEIMKKPLGSVKSLIRYGLRNLRKQKSIFNWTESSGGGNRHEL
ncbi:RNA polymerase sigma factor [Oceanobacillus halophilus]|uniref:RNA polymerase sigma factor n=1 Tax=Oceanobacillus halophilus TaxID=930130 RepID=A0A495A7L5_9BACI|nr:RNA polymerase sigma factor [Oceanobacillus halophilus]RKQ35703.1 RNA polymerase sigma factor [Oceanobacillus halophilus]